MRISCSVFLTQPSVTAEPLLPYEAREHRNSSFPSSVPWTFWALVGVGLSTAFSPALPPISCFWGHQGVFPSFATSLCYQESLLSSLPKWLFPVFFNTGKGICLQACSHQDIPAVVLKHVLGQGGWTFPHWPNPMLMERNGIAEMSARSDREKRKPWDWAGNQRSAEPVGRWTQISATGGWLCSFCFWTGSGGASSDTSPTMGSWLGNLVLTLLHHHSQHQKISPFWKVNLLKHILK